MRRFWLCLGLLTCAAGCDSSGEPGDDRAGGDGSGGQVSDAAGSTSPDAGSAPGADAAITGSDGATSSADAGGTDPERGVVRCGTSTCNLASDVCCVSLSGSMCKALAMCGGGLAAPQRCDGPEDCSGGKICCVGFPDGASCATSCSGNQQELCHVTANCAGGKTCKACSFPGSPPTNVCVANDTCSM